MVSNSNGDLPQAPQGKVPSKPGKSNGIPQNLITKVTRGFVDAVYKFLDGIMLLASNDAPIAKDCRKLASAISVSPEIDLAEVMDLKDGVSFPAYHFESLADLRYFGNFFFFF